MTNLVVHPKTEATLATLAKQLPHAVLLSGAKGVGLATIARQLAGEGLVAFMEPTDSKGVINHETGTISVAAIRNLYEQTRAKSLQRQVYVIDDADRMSAGASAAFLKLLEEPTNNTHFILTSHTPQALLPTIHSRLQTTIVEHITSTQTRKLIDTLGVADQKTKTQLEYLGMGLPAELTRLTSNTEYFNKRAQTMADTRTFLTGSLYQKILITHKYHQDRPEALQLLDSALMVTKRSLDAKPQPELIDQLESLLSTRERIEANGNTRLQLLAFVVQ